MTISLNFNINDHVKIRLTDKGRLIVQKQHADLFKNYPPHATPVYHPRHEDPSGWSEWQLHDVMRTFGPHISVNSRLMGGLLFETEIRIDL